MGQYWASTGTRTYTFTPTAGQCAIAVDFDGYCDYEPDHPDLYCCSDRFAEQHRPCFDAPADESGITDMWSPATVSTATIGTTAYTFTPAAGQCATAVTMDIPITRQITPTFGKSDCFVRTAQPLFCRHHRPKESRESGIMATVSTAYGRDHDLYVHTCGRSVCIAVTMDIAITNQLTPAFTQLGPLCQNSTAPALANQLDQYAGHHGNVESCHDQHNNCRNHNLHVYPDCWAVCNCCDDGYCDYQPDHPDVRRDRTTLPEQHSPCFACNINRRNHGNLEFCHGQHDNHRNHNLHVYPCCRSVCRSNYA